MQFTNPIWLFGLSGVLVPLAIHLLSRKEGKLIRVGSTRHLEETSTRQFKSIKLNEILLLALRSLLIVWVVLLLSGLHWPDANIRKTNWLLIEKGFEHDQDFSILTDSLKEEGYEVRELTEGFPLLKDSIAQFPSDYWELIESLKEKSIGEAVIISSSRVAAFRGQRTDLPSNFTWITKPLPPKEAILSSWKIGIDSVWVRKGKYNSEQTAFETVKLHYASGMRVADPDTLQIDLIHNKKYEYDSRIIQASLRAIDEFVPHVINIRIYSPEEFKSNAINDWTIWLSDQKIPAIAGNKIIAMGVSSNNLIQQTVFNTWIITQRLHTDNALDDKLTMSLAGILFPETEAWQKARTNDIRTADEKIFSSKDQTTKATHSSSNADALWVVAIALTLIAERIVSFVRKQ